MPSSPSSSSSSVRTKIALVGPGAIGGTLAAWLAQVARNDLVVCARTPFDTLRVDVPDGPAPLEIAPVVLVDPAAATHMGGVNGGVDWVIAVTKTYDASSAARWIEALRGPTTCVAVIQNGVEHMDRFSSDLIPRERVLPVIIDIPAERKSPGHVIQRRHGNITLPKGELGARFVALFEGTPLAPAMTDDFLSAAWRKLALNSAGVVNALTQKPSRVVQNEKAAALMRDIATETVAVGRAVGAKLDDSLVDEVIGRLRASHPDSVNSLLADRLANRRMEIDARNGVIVRLGKKHGVPTPLNAMAVAILEAAATS